MAENIQDLLKDIQAATPELAAQNLATQQEQIPELARLATRLQGQEVPEQLRLDLAQLREFAPQFADIQAQMASTERERTLQDVLGLTPTINEIQRQAVGPEAFALRETLGQQISQDLEAGDKLTPEQLRSTEQGVRSSQFARGLGQGQGSANREAVQRALAGRELQGQRQGRASDFINQLFSQATQPFSTVQSIPLSGTQGAQAAVQSPGTLPSTIGQPFNTQALTSPLLQAQLGLSGQQQQASQFGEQFGAEQANQQRALQLQGLQMRDPDFNDPGSQQLLAQLTGI